MADSPKPTVGIFGMGSFGIFVSSLVPKSSTIRAYDKSRKSYPKSVIKSTFEEVAKCDIIILCVPISSYKNTVAKLAKTIMPNQLVVDVCSVKIKSEQIINSYLPDHSNILFSHPLFGPQSYKENTDNNKLIITGERGELAKEAIKYCRDNLHLEIIRLSADEHDRLMADVHVLTFFVARGLAILNLKDHKFATPSYKMIMDLVKLDASQSNELFLTIQKANPYADKITKQAIKAFAQVEKQIKESKSVVV